MPNSDPVPGRTAATTDPRDVPATVSEVIAFEPLPLRANGSRRAIVRWSDGSVGEALRRWYDDEILVSEGDLLGRTLDELRQLHFRRDRDHLQSPGN